MVKAPEIVEISPDDLNNLDPDALSDHLECGRVVIFTAPPLELPGPADLTLLLEELPSRITLKNISYYPQAGRVSGYKGDKGLRKRAREFLKRYHLRVQECLERVVPRLTPNILPGTSSFRPIQEKGRDLSVRASNERIHVDAKAYGATHGDRVFRFFTNINPTEDRVWRVKGTLPDLLQTYGQDANVGQWGADKDDLRPRMVDKITSGIVRGICKVAPMARSIDNSPYDRAMRRFHNFMKESQEFQEGDEGAVVTRFKPMSCWMVLTDMVGHSCIEGQHCMINTFIIPDENCLHRELTPTYLLTHAAGKR